MSERESYFYVIKLINHLDVYKYLYYIDKNELKTLKTKKKVLDCLYFNVFVIKLCFMIKKTSFFLSSENRSDGYRI